VQAQTMTDLELLVVDDGSADDTAAVLAQLDDPRVRVVRHERNRGIACARNTALRATDGEWVAFLDDDNEWAPDYLERQLAFGDTVPQAGVIYCRARRLDVRTGRMMLVPYRMAQGEVLDAVIVGWIPLMSGTMLRRTTLEAIGEFDETLESSEDRDVFVRLALQCRFAGTEEILVTRHEHFGAQLSRSPERLRRDAERLVAKWGALIADRGGRRAAARWRAMLVSLAEMSALMQGVERAQRAEARRALRRMAAHLPWSAPAVARGLVFLAAGPEAFGRAGLAWASLRASVLGTARARPYHRS
jgi:glycosyltransferase involved in cell wall biosynthesis